MFSRKILAFMVPWLFLHLTDSVVIYYGELNVIQVYVHEKKTIAS